jgi:hypothetical protein
LEWLENWLFSLETKKQYLDFQESIFGKLLPKPTNFSEILYGPILYAKECFYPTSSIAKLLGGACKSRKTGLTQMIEVRMRGSVEKKSVGRSDLEQMLQQADQAVLGQDYSPHDTFDPQVFQHTFFPQTPAPNQFIISHTGGGAGISTAGGAGGASNITTNTTGGTDFSDITWADLEDTQS